MWRTFILMLITPAFGLAAGTTPPLKLDLQPDNATEYSGDLGGKTQIGMTLRINPDGRSLTGVYYYDKYARDIQFTGTLTGRDIVLHEFNANGDITGQFTGQFQTADPRHQFCSKDPLNLEVLTGSWSKPDGTHRQPFYLSADYSGAWAPGERYAAACVDETEGDAFMARYRQAILDHNTRRVAEMTTYPIKVSLAKDKDCVEIQNARQLTRHFDEIFRPNFLARLRKTVPTHMFAKCEGVMLGQGEIWITDAEIDGKNQTIVLAINNDIGE